MSLEQILQIFETMLNAALKGGLFHHHDPVKQAIIAKEELQKHVDAATTAAAATPAADNSGAPLKSV